MGASEVIAVEYESAGLPASIVDTTLAAIAAAGYELVPAGGGTPVEVFDSVTAERFIVAGMPSTFLVSVALGGGQAMWWREGLDASGAMTRSTPVIAGELGALVEGQPIGATTPAAGTFSSLSCTGDALRVHVARTPASASARGNAGEWCWDADYLYVCIATDTWRRVAHASW